MNERRPVEANPLRGAIQITAWHGTNVETAAVIQREGFKPDCWFALDPRDALAYGGPVLLGVRFAVSGLPVDDDPTWQFHHPEPIPAERIVAVLAESARIEALEAALRTALDICQDWIDNGDFDGPQSALEAELLPLRAVLNLSTAISAAPGEQEAPGETTGGHDA